MTSNNGHSPITADELRALKPLTAGDFYWGHKNADKLADGTDDSTDLMVHAVHHAAVRAKLAKEGDLYGFLDRVELDALTSMFGDELTEPEGDLAKTRTGS